MTMRYADEATVLAELHLDPENEADAAAIARVQALELGLCETFDEKIGRSFGETPGPQTRTIAVGQGWGASLLDGMPLADYRNSFGSSRLVLSTPVRLVTSINVAGSWNGTAWVDGQTLAPDTYLLTNQARDGSYAIERPGGTWSGYVRVTAIWADQPVSTVPVDVREAMTFIVAETYRQQQASPADDLGPEGMMVRPRNPWNYEQVKTAIARHRIVKVLL